MHKYFCIYICLLSVFHGLACWRLPNTKLALLFGAFESVLSTFGERRAASARKETSQTFWFLGLFKGVSQKTTQGCSGFWDSKTKQPILTLNEKTNKSGANQQTKTRRTNFARRLSDGSFEGLLRGSFPEGKPGSLKLVKERCKRREKQKPGEQKLCCGETLFAFGLRASYPGILPKILHEYLALVLHRDPFN